mgnify:FL=1
MRKRVLSLVLVWAMFMSMLPGALAAEAHSHDTTIRCSDGKLILGDSQGTTPDDLTDFDGTVYKKVYYIWKNKNCYLSENLELDHPLAIFNANVSICLNGYSITYDGKTASPDNYADVIIVSSTATFTLQNCKASSTPAHEHPICGAVCADKAHNASEWTGVAALTDGMTAGNYYLTDSVTLSAPWHPANGTALCLNGQTITAGGDFTAIDVADGVQFTLTDCGTAGAITGAACGIHNAGELRLYGGSITGNTAGVEQNGTMTVAGRARVAENRSRNVYLPENRCIHMDGALDKTALFGIATENPPTPGNPVAVADGVSADDAAHFISDAGYALSCENGTLSMYAHEHEWTYTSDGTAITAACKADNVSGGQLTLHVPSNAVYDGRPKTAVVVPSADWAGGTADIVYTKTGVPDFTGEPVDAGSYTAALRLGEAEVSAAFAIAKADWTTADFTVAVPRDLVYNGEVKAVSVTSAVTDGEITVQYYRGNQAVLPVNAGTYTVRIDVTEGANYNSASLASDKWMFTIAKASQSIVVPTDRTVMRNGLPVDMASWVTAQGEISFELAKNTPGVTLSGTVLTVSPEVKADSVSIRVRAAANENYNAATRMFTVMLTDKQRKTLDIRMDGWQYGDMPAQPEYTAQGEVSIVYTNENGAFIGAQPPTNAGNYNVTVTYETDTEIFSGTTAFVIRSKPLAEAMAGNLPAMAYTGQSIRPEPEITDGTALRHGIDFTYRYSENTNVGLGSVTIVGQGNYTGEIVRAFEITKAILAVTGTPTAGAVYGTRVRDIPITGLTVSLNGTAIHGDWAFAGEVIPNANTTTAYTAIFTPAAGAENYQPLTTDIVPHITKAPGSVTPPTACEQLIYNGQPQTLIEAGTSNTGTMQYRLEGGEYQAALPQAKNAGIYKVWYKSVGNENHEDTAEAFLEVEIAKQSIAIPTADDTAYIYNGEAQTYQLKEDSAYRIEGSRQTNAGAYFVTAALVDSDNTEWQDGKTDDKTYPFCIVKAVVTITAANHTVTVGDALPDWSTPVLGRDYTVRGLFGTDTLRGSLKLRCSPASDLTRPGQTDIIAEGADAGDNYTIVYKPGKLTVQARTTASGGGGGSSSSSSAPRHTVSVPSGTAGGSVKSGTAAAVNGSTVLITATPDAGYRLDKLTVTDAKGNTLVLTEKGNGQYSFTMPSGQVTITPVFVKEAASEPQNLPVRDISETDYFYAPVRWAAEQGITSGVSEEHFAPEDGCTRAQIVTFLWRAAGSPVVNCAMDLIDVPMDSYCTDAVRWALSEGITTGIAAQLFGPDEICTRAQAVTFLARAKKAEADGETAFSDVPFDSYYADAVAWAASNGITSGVSAEHFAPGDTCTRAQIVTFLYRSFAEDK